MESIFRRALLDNGYTELPILSEHTLAISGLLPLHKDPFDSTLAVMDRRAMATKVENMQADKGTKKPRPVDVPVVING